MSANGAVNERVKLNERKLLRKLIPRRHRWMMTVDQNADLETAPEIREGFEGGHPRFNVKF
jgi:hypothetical protein